MIKYRVHEVAKDFGTTYKALAEILTKYAETPKNHMQVLTDRELNIIFDYLTFHHQVASLDEIYAEGRPAQPKAPEKAPEPVKAAPEAAAEKAPEPVKAAPQKQAPAQPEQKPVQPVQPAAQGQKQPQAQGGRPQQGAKQPQAQAPQQGQKQPQQGTKPPQTQAQQPGQQGQKQPQQGQPSSRVPQKRVIDTRSTTLNTAKYDERLDKFVPEKLQNAKQGKEKIGGRKDKRSGANAAASGAKRRQEQRAQMQKLQLEIAKKAPVKVTIPDEISVGELASRMKKTGAEVVRTLIKMKVMASLSDVIDYDTAALVAMELGCKVEHEVVVSIEEQLIDDREDTAEELLPRSPVVVVMGHVDHGKTSLLDKIRHAHVAEGEAGGITQAIGAYQVEINGKTITFLDTPGHEAFTSMRARGAMVTDIAILVVAADDGIMPQTIEAINHAKAANVPIVVAINKIDKPGADPDRVAQQLTEYGLVSEDWGGDTIVVPVSAKKNINLDTLLEMVLLQADVLELRANPNRLAKGTVIEAKLDKARGPLATVLVQNGTLKKGDTIIAGTAYGRIRAMIDDKGRTVNSAGPSTPVEILGFNEVPEAGDVMNVADADKLTRQVAEERKDKIKAAQIKAMQKVSLDELFNQMAEGDLKELNIIVKADVQGSAEAVKQSLEKLSNDEVRVRCIHAAVGAISESDIMFASASNAIVIGFNVRPDATARTLAEKEKVDVRTYRVIYNAIEDVEAAMKGLFKPVFKEVEMGRVSVRNTFKISGVGTIAGAYVQDGKVTRSAQVRVVRDGVVVYDGKISSLKRFKDDVKEVASGYECGISFENFNDIHEGDVIEAYTMEQVER